MTFQLVQIIGKPKEDMVDVLRQELNQESLVQSIESEGLEGSDEILLSALPDLVVIFIDSLPGDQQKEDTIGFCQEIRGQMSEHRPIIVISSESGEKDDRIEFFLSGADDYLPLDIEPEEFAVRLLVHLRRNVELLSNSQTRLPGLPLFSRLIQRRVNLEMPWCLLMVELNNFNAYNEAYGKMPSEQILKTLAAQLKHLVLPPDIVGQMDNETFLILTTPDKGEKIAKGLCSQFDENVPNFYSERDQKRGYIISMVNEQISQRVSFVCLSIGIVSSENTQHKNHMTVFNHAIDMKNVARANYGSSWASERARLTGHIETQAQRIKKILVTEGDAAMAFLLKSTLEMQGYIVETTNTQEEAQALLSENGSESTVDLLLMDPLEEGEIEKWDLFHWIREQESLKHLKIICMSTLHNRENALNAGADLYLPKPFEIGSLFTWVDRFLKS